MCSLWPWISTNQLATCCSTCCVTVRPLMRPTVRPEAKISRERIRCPSSGVISYVCKSVARATRASALSASAWFVTVCCVSTSVNPWSNVPVPLPSALNVASNGCHSSLMGGRASMEKTPSTVARSVPERTTSTPILPPSSALIASMMIDLPAPVSPVNTLNRR